MNKVHVVTVATHKQGLFDKLINNDYGIKVKVLGFGKKWSGFNMKYEEIISYMENLSDDDILIYLDGFDTEINGN